jgi:aminoglycoside phosphotransferase (APT) family kinase protein
LAGGMFGACRVEGSGGRQLVLKAWPLPEYAAQWERAAALAGVMRERGYPAPEYIGAGSYSDGCWSLQEFLPGEVVVQLGPVLVTQLVALAVSQADVADVAGVEGDPWLDMRSNLAASVAMLRQRPEAAGMAEELASLLEVPLKGELRRGDVVHGDFHPGNVLVSDDAVVGVIDWEGAHVGDWRSDLANLVVTGGGEVSERALREVASPELAAFLVGGHCARYLAFDATNHPERLASYLQQVDAGAAAWWRR